MSHKAIRQEKPSSNLKGLDARYLAEQNRTRRPQTIDAVTSEANKALDARIRGEDNQNGQDIELESMTQRPWEPRGKGGTGKGEEDYQGG